MASYKIAIEWLVFNDDNYWTEKVGSSASVTACFIADLFKKSDEEVRADLIKALKRHNRWSGPK